MFNTECRLKNGVNASYQCLAISKKILAVDTNFNLVEWETKKGSVDAFKEHRFKNEAEWMETVSDEESSGDSSNDDESNLDSEKEDHE